MTRRCCSLAVAPCTSNGSADDLADGHPWVQRCVRILEHHLEPASCFAQVTSRQLGQLDPVESNRPDCWVRSGAAHSAAVVLLPQPDSPTNESASPGADVERHARYRVHRRRLGSPRCASQLELLHQIADLHERPRSRSQSSRCCRSPRSTVIVRPRTPQPRRAARRRQPTTR